MRAKDGLAPADYLFWTSRFTHDEIVELARAFWPS
jgi:hypothetical protein